jgi:AN1-type zinc finger and ubiquitin domain-containing protein 1
MKHDSMMNLFHILSSVNSNINQEIVEDKKPEENIVVKPIIEDFPKRCQFGECKKKLKLTDFKCKCNKVFCMNHKFSELHKCDYDYKTDGLQNLEKKLVKVVGNGNLTKI